MGFDLISPLSRQDCVLRLKSKADPAWSDAVTGSVGESSFRLSRRIAYRNSFQPCVSGTLIDDNGQTRLHCRIGLHPLVRAFCIVWFGVVSIACVAIIAAAAGMLTQHTAPAKLWPGAAVPFLMLTGGAALVGFGKFIGRDDADFLKVVLRRTLEAHEGDRSAH
jgi:hypothetical protein